MKLCLKSIKVLEEPTVGAALCGRPLAKTEHLLLKRVATEGHPYSCALGNLTFEAKLSDD
jgi:hypothetical protein